MWEWRVGGGGGGTCKNSMWQDGCPIGLCVHCTSGGYNMEYQTAQDHKLGNESDSPTHKQSSKCENLDTTIVNDIKLDVPLYCNDLNESDAIRL